MNTTNNNDEGQSKSNVFTWGNAEVLPDRKPNQTKIDSPKIEIQHPEYSIKISLKGDIGTPENKLITKRERGDLHLKAHATLRRIGESAYWVR